MTKLHVSDEELLAVLLAEGVDEGVSEALDEALLEALVDADETTGALLDAHSAPLDEPEPVGEAESEPPGAPEPLVHAASASVRARDDARSGPREVFTAGKVVALSVCQL